MTSQVFYRKWRPQTLTELVGQEQVTKTLLNALSSDRVSHAYLFCGPRGTGKTSTGRILAKAVNCLNNGKGEPCNTCAMCQAITEGGALDVIEIDAASNTGVDDIRSLRERVNYVPNQARYKVYIIDEVHMLSNSASNALLKTLEEPPSHVIFILATTEAHKIIPTILSRCQRFDFRRLTQVDIVSKLSRICSVEDIKIEPEALRLIAKAASGSLRDAENLLEQLTTYYGSEIEIQQVQTVLGVTGDWRTRELVKHIINNDVAAGLITINSVNNDGLDLKQFNRELVEYLRALLMIKTGSGEIVDLTVEDIAELKDISDIVSLPQILRAVKIFGQLELSFDSYSALPLELAMVDCVLSSEKNEESTIINTKAEISHPAKTIDITLPDKSITKHETVTDQKTTTIKLPEEGSELEQLRANWKKVVTQAPADMKRTPAMAFLRSSGVKPVAFEDNTIVLSFKYPYHKEKMGEPQNQKVAEKIISKFLGHPCSVRCVCEPEDNHLVKEAQRLGAQITSVEEK
ncbi:MAG: DNA polymerase III subunit gamma/tau [Dehalococcoidales bacterium]|nr:DNA polymerase III subunit gamma/tau [Dehalococcoidales bacterium]